MSNELSTQREVTLFYTQSNERKTLLSSAKTWGDLSNEIGESFAKSKVVLQESRLTLENTEAMLPNNPFTLFVFPRQSKAGVSNKDRDWSKMKYNELRSVASKLNKTKNAGINMGGSKDAIAVGVSKFYGGTGKFSAPVAKKKATPKAKVIKPAAKKAAPAKAKVAPKKVVAKAKPSKVVKEKVAKVVKSVGDDLNKKIEKAKTSGMTDKQYNSIIDKLDEILSIINKAMPSIDVKELNALKDLASTVRGTMETMR